MASRLLLVLALWVGCSPCSGRKAAPTQPRVRCRASRYPIAVDCSWTLLPTAHSAKPTSFIASYRLGVAAHGESRPCLQLTPEATSCTIPDVQLFSMVPYILNVTAVQPWGSSSSFVPFVPEHIRVSLPAAPDLASCLSVSQTRPSRRRPPEPPPWTAAVGAVGTPPVLALPRDLLTQVLDPIQASQIRPLPPGGAY
ncbi:interleukin-27 subunit beta isoform X3 [Callorhinus ursinus]|uniref:interleukin-27 subunit beta isoform X3 n=1 Tax=Callorhinus ursinus TaxID=34884 RepID=UPI003CD01981